MGPRNVPGIRVRVRVRVRARVRARVRVKARVRVRARVGDNDVNFERPSSIRGVYGST
jgi:hypothetical protein